MFDAYAHNLAFQCAFRSPDPSTQVGAVVVNREGRVVGEGWNDFPQGIPKDWWNDSRKYKAVIHAEMRALTMAGHEALGGTIYVTSHPCRECAKAILAAGIKVVWSPKGPWRNVPEVVDTCNDAKELFRLCGVTHSG